MQVTQEDKILKRLKDVGYVDNFWAVKNFILRLGGMVHYMELDNLIRVYGNKITNYSPKDQQKNKKNFHYILKKRCVVNKDGTVTLK